MRNKLRAVLVLLEDATWYDVHYFQNKTRPCVCWYDKLISLIATLTRVAGKVLQILMVSGDNAVYSILFDSFFLCQRFTCNFTCLRGWLYYAIFFFSVAVKISPAIIRYDGICMPWGLISSVPLGLVYCEHFNDVWSIIIIMVIFLILNVYVDELTKTAWSFI